MKILLIATPKQLLAKNTRDTISFYFIKRLPIDRKGGSNGETRGKRPALEIEGRIGGGGSKREWGRLELEWGRRAALYTMILLYELYSCITD